MARVGNSRFIRPVNQPGIKRQLMKKIIPLTLTGTMLAGGMLSNQSARAGGISLYEIAAPDVGLASAGYSARAQDASTVFKNPAGMSQLGDGPQIQAGAQILYGDVKFSPSQPAPQGGGDGDNAVGGIPGASFFYAQKLTDRVAVGFGMFSYFGLAENYDSNWAGRYYVQKGTLLVLEPHAGGERQDQRLALGRRFLERDVWLSGHGGGHQYAEAQRRPDEIERLRVGFWRSRQHPDHAPRRDADRGDVCLAGETEFQRHPELQQPWPDRVAAYFQQSVGVEPGHHGDAAHGVGVSVRAGHGLAGARIVERESGL